MRKAIQGSMVLAVLLGAFAEADPIQWPTADGGNGHYYEAISYPAGITWGDAESYAAGCVYSGLEGHLATITSAAENRFIANGLGASVDHYWLGGYQPPGSPEPDGGWTWITGEPWGYTNWAGGEANNSYGGDGIIPRPDLKYLHEEALQFKNNRGQWNDVEEYSGWGGLIVEYESLTTQYVVEGRVVDWNDKPIGNVKVQVEGVSGEILWAGSTDSNGIYKTEPPIEFAPFEVSAILDNEVVQVKDCATELTILKTKTSPFPPAVNFDFGSQGAYREQERDAVLIFRQIHEAREEINNVYGYCEDRRALAYVFCSESENTIFGTINFERNVFPFEGIIWHEYAHFVHRSILGGMRIYQVGAAMREAWAIYYELDSSSQLGDENIDINQGRINAGDLPEYYAWGYVYASIFNDIADGVSLSEWDFIDGERLHRDAEDGTQVNGHEMIWKVLMEDEVGDILGFHDRLAARYPELRWGLAQIFRIHNIPGYDGYYPPLQLSGRIGPGQSQTAEAILNTSLATGLFHLEWPGSDLDLMLVSPSGLTIDPTYAQQDANIVFVEGPTEEYYVVEQPEAGEWQMHVTAVDVPPEGEDYTVTVSLTTHLMLILTCDKETYTPGEPVSLRAELLYDANSYSDANVVAQVRTPLGTKTVPLFDDGLHNDADSDDGIYANVYTDTLTAGDYQITATASGLNPFGEPFVRETGKTILVQDLPDLALYDLTINQGQIDAPAVVAVRVLNEGTRDANEILVTLYDVNDTEPIQIGEDIGIDYLAPGESQDVSIVWDAPAGAHDLYVVVDYLHTVPESDEANNLLTRRFCAEWKIFGDLNQDCIINFLDLALLGNQWLASCSGPGWCEAADLDQNGRVGASDLSLMAHNWLHEHENPPIVISPSEN